jgi:phosphotriesterase-related protein
MKTRNMFQLGTVLVAVLALVHGLPILAAAQQSRIPDLSGKILTVRGPIEPAELGKTLMHEHILIDFQKPAHLTGVKRGQHRDITAATDWGLFYQPVSLKNLSAVRNGVAPNRDNLDLSDIDVAIDEVLHFKRWGGTTIVDVTSIGLGRDPTALVQVANATGLNIVMGAGYYQKQFHPPDMGERTVEQLTDVIIADVTVGADGTSVRSGIIGEVGINGNPLNADEIKSIRAAARASRATGAAISFHVGGYMEEKFTVIDTVIAEGVDVARVIMGHSNSIAKNVPFMKRLLERGVYIQFDTLGRMGSRLGGVKDGDVAQGIVELVKLGYEDRILLSQDVCHKIEIKRYGGTGFSYILEFVLPELKRRGVTDSQVYKMMVENPARVLTFAKPAPPLSSSAAGRDE